MPRRGRPRADRLDLLEQVVRRLADDPTLSANEVARRVPARRRDVLRYVAALRAAESFAQVRTTNGEGGAGAAPSTRFPNPQTCAEPEVER
jgi:predicted DNA-binding transcriptional regulator YafY